MDMTFHDLMVIRQHHRRQLNEVEMKMNEKIEGTGMDLKKFEILYLVFHSKNILTITKIAESLTFHVSTVFNYSKALEMEGYLSIIKSNGDRRRSFITLTEKGREFINKI